MSVVSPMLCCCFFF